MLLMIRVCMTSSAVHCIMALFAVTRICGNFMAGDTKEFIDRVVIAKKAIVPDHTREHSTQRQNTQRDQHDDRAFMRVFMCMFVTTRRAIKGQENQTPAIERCEQRCDHQHPERIAACGAGPCAFNHRVFGQEPSKAKVR